MPPLTRPRGGVTLTSGSRPLGPGLAYAAPASQEALPKPAVDSRKEMPEANVGAVVVAAGGSRRMGGTDKLFAPLMGRPLIAYSLDTLNGAPEVDAIILVLSRGNLEEGRRLARSGAWAKVADICVGGARRQDSVRHGVDRLPDAGWVIVHDGARPFIEGGMIARGLAEARSTGAAVAAVPVNDTIKSADTDQIVNQTIPRDGLWAVQTPQVFRRDLLMDAHRQVQDDVTDDAAMVERAGGRVRLFMGSYHNLKITTPDDMLLAEGILRARTAQDPSTSR